MSLILEALRKSEAERRRGRAPDLYAELPPPAAPRRRGPAAWVVAMCVVVVLLLVAVVFWPRGEDTVVASRDAARADVRPAAQEATPIRDNTTGRDATPNNATSAPAFPRIDRLSPPAAPAADATPPEAPSPAEQTPPTDAIRDTPETTRLPDAATPDLPPPADPVARAPAPAAPPPSTADAPIRYTELSAPERQQLPPMKLTMHLWNETSARRFVIIDNQRYVEGDRIGSGTVAAIDPDGVVIELNGRRVRVPLR